MLLPILCVLNIMSVDWLSHDQNRHGKYRGLMLKQVSLCASYLNP